MVESVEPNGVEGGELADAVEVPARAS